MSHSRKDDSFGDITAVVIRVETTGDDAGRIIAVFSGTKGTTRAGQDACAWDPKYGHYSIDRRWYEQNTRPATHDERRAIFPQLIAAGYNVPFQWRVNWKG